MPQAGRLKSTPAADLLHMLRTMLRPDGGQIDPVGFFNVLDRWERDRAAEEVAEEVRRMQVEEAQDVHFKLIALMLDKGAAYTNLVVLAGYAAFFALMPLVKDLITPHERRAAVLCMLVSVAAFVGFEVYKMIFLQLGFIGRLADYNKAAAQPSFDFVDANTQLQKDLNRRSVVNMWIWKFCITVGVLSGLAALLILAVTLVTNSGIL